MPSTSNLQQRVALFNLFKGRAVQKREGLAMSAMVNQLDMEDEGQLLDAMKTLEKDGYIRVDIWGRFPAVVVLKDKWRDGETVCWPVPPGKPAVPGDAAPKHDAVPVKAAPAPITPVVPNETKIEGALPSPVPPPKKATKPKSVIAFKREPDAAHFPTKPVEPVKMPPYKFQQPENGGGAVSQPKPIVGKIEATPNPSPVRKCCLTHEDEDHREYCSSRISPVEAAARMERPIRAEPRSVAFTLPQKDYDALLEEMERSGLSITLPSFCIQLLRTEMARRTSEDAAKHKISAEIVLAAQEDGKPVIDFVREMVAAGMAARAERRAAA